MSATIIMSSVATSQAVAAQAAAHEARVAQCKTEMTVYNPKTATIAEIKEYSSCANELYPDPPSRGDIIVIKVLIVAGLIGMVIGVFASDNDWLDRLVGGFMGLIVAPFFLFVVCGVFYGIYFLFS